MMNTYLACMTNTYLSWNDEHLLSLNDEHLLGLNDEHLLGLSSLVGLNDEHLPTWPEWRTPMRPKNCVLTWQIMFEPSGGYLSIYFHSCMYTCRHVVMQAYCRDHGCLQMTLTLVSPSHRIRHTYMSTNSAPPSHISPLKCYFFVLPFWWPKQRWYLTPH